MRKIKKLYLQVTTDKYRLPLLVADSPKELAKMMGTKDVNINSALSHAKKRRDNSMYEVVEYDAEEYEKEMRQYYEN